MLGCPTNRAQENYKKIIKKRAYLFKIRYNGIVQKPETEEQDMLSCHYTKDLLNLQGVNIIKIEQFELDTFIHTQLPIKPHI